MGVKAVGSIDVGKKISVKVIPNKYRGRNSGRMGLFSLETSRIQPLLWGRPRPSVLNVPIVPIQENSSDSQPPALPQTVATLHLQHQCVWGHRDPSHGLHSWVILFDCQHLHSLAALDHCGPAVGTLIAQVLLILEPSANLDWDHPMLRGTRPRGPSGPLSSVFLFLDTPKPFVLHGPTLQDSLHPLATNGCVPGIPVVHRSPLVSDAPQAPWLSPLLSGRHRPLVHGPTPRFPLSPASGTPRRQGPVGPIGHQGPTVRPKWFPRG